MDATKITITINAGADILSAVGKDNFRKLCPKSKQKSISGSPSVENCSMTVQLGAALINRRVEAAIGEVTSMDNGVHRNRNHLVTVVQRSQSPIRSPMPTLPYPPKHATNNGWKKVPPIPKLTVVTGPGMIQLTWDDGFGIGSYHMYAAVAGQELFACVFDGECDHNEGKWEKLTFIKASPPGHSRRRPIVCNMTDMPTGVEYYFAVRAVDIHNRRGPCAFVYARL